MKQAKKAKKAKKACISTLLLKEKIYIDKSNYCLRKIEY